VTARHASPAWLAVALIALAASLAFVAYTGYRALAQPEATMTTASTTTLLDPHAPPPGARATPAVTHGSSPARLPAEDPRAGVAQTPEEAFRDLRSALERRDAVAAARYLLAGKRAQMSNVEQALGELTALDAQDVRVTKTTQRGDKAAIFARAKSPDITSADGTPAAIDVVVQLLREDGQWKVFRQLWLVNTPPAEFQQEAMAWLR